MDIETILFQKSFPKNEKDKKRALSGTSRLLRDNGTSYYLRDNPSSGAKARIDFAGVMAGLKVPPLQSANLFRGSIIDAKHEPQIPRLRLRYGARPPLGMTALFVRRAD